MSDQIDVDTRLPFLDPEGRSICLRIEEDAQILRVLPSRIPTWIIVVLLGVPAAAFAWIIADRVINNGIDVRAVLESIFVCAAVLACWAILSLIYRQSESRGPYFVLRKDSGALELPRVPVRLERHQLVEFVEVRGWRYDPEGKSWMGELSVIARDNAGQFQRYSVLVNDATRPVSQIGRKLALFFDVKLTVQSDPSVLRSWFRSLRGHRAEKS